MIQLCYIRAIHELSVIQPHFSNYQFQMISILEYRQDKGKLKREKERGVSQDDQTLQHKSKT